MKGGGSYYIISRSVGPELGGAIGVLFYFAYSVGATFYVVAFSTTLSSTFFAGQEIFSPYWMQIIVGTVTLVIILIISLIGAGFFTKINVLLFIVQFGSILYGVGSILFTRYHGELPSGGYFMGWGGQNFVDNFMWDFNNVGLCEGGDCSFLYVFSIIFPAVTGIMEGANLSGDLADPHRSIWRGTLMAIFGSFFFYIVCMVTFAGGFTRETLQLNSSVFQETSFFSQYLVVVGVLISTSSSALGAVFGGSRILQAISRDKLLPGISIFGYGTTKGDEPIYAVIVTFLIAEACLFAGDLDFMAPIITCFFCLSYGFTNLSCFLVAISGTPNFRPRFKYFTWHTALVGFLLNIAVMFMLEYLYALIAVILWILLFIYLVVFYTPEQAGGWGDVRKAIIFHQVRKYLFHLDPRENHGKLWRPSLLLCVDRLDSPLTEFCNYLKKGGVYILGSVIVGNLDDMNLKREESESAFMDYVKSRNLKAFVQVFIAPTLRIGFHNLMVGAGLGALTCNTVVLPLVNGEEDEEDYQIEEGGLRSRKTQTSVSMAASGLVEILDSPLTRQNLISDSISAHETVKLILDATRLQKNIIVACNFPSCLDVKDLLEPSSEKTIDIWVPANIPIDSFEDFEGTPLLQVELGHILKRSSKISLRFLKAVSHSFTSEDREKLVDIIKRQARFRIGSQGSQIFLVNAESEKIDNDQVYTKEYALNLNTVIKKQDKSNSSVIILSLPPIPEVSSNLSPSECEDVAAEYLHTLRTLTQGLPPTLLVMHAKGQKVMSTSI
eukprot:TRINITY_DN5856_c0_g1_i1.p1 TRINITY_DN5856_c0_g1~~TRINITY_DN5856_c0_g1_i1.p1  ORF type:complete len:869 (+),score=181.60 TRINITY_DN5856_c0_g1_i1:269-2608(+)